MCDYICILVMDVVIIVPSPHDRTIARSPCPRSILKAEELNDKGEGAAAQGANIGIGAAGCCEKLQVYLDTG